MIQRLPHTIKQQANAAIAPGSDWNPYSSYREEIFMSFQDRRYNRDGGGWGGSGFGSRSPGYSGGSDLGWRILALLNASFPAGTYLDIRVRVHITFFLLLIFRLFQEGDPAWTLRWTGLLFGSVLLHEFGHCLACRKVGGQANEILMWPLGGLAYVAPPRRPWPEFVTVIWGPLVNVILAGISYLALLAWVRSSQSEMPVSLHPLQPWAYLPANVWVALLADLFVVNYMLLLFNMLLIFYPFDGGRLVQIALWTRVGYARSLRIATSFGMGGAILTALFAIATERSLLLMIAIFGFIACYQQARQLREMGDFAYASDGGAEAWSVAEKPPGFFKRRNQLRQQKRAERQAAQRRHQEAQIDLILDKVHRQGLASLTQKERRILQESSRQKRNS